MFKYIRKIGFLLTLLILLSGCASQQSSRANKENITGLNARISSLESSMINKWDAFSKNYSPKMRLELKQNLNEVKQQSNAIRKLKVDSESNHASLSKMHLNSQKDVAAINRNRRESSSKNVVNEFNSLKNRWRRTESTLLDSVDVSRQAATDSQRDAKIARGSAGKIHFLQIRLHEIENNVGQMTDAMAFLENKDDFKKHYLKDLYLKLKRLENEVAYLRDKLGIKRNRERHH